MSAATEMMCQLILVLGENIFGIFFTLMSSELCKFHNVYILSTAVLREWHSLQSLKIISYIQPRA